MQSDLQVSQARTKHIGQPFEPTASFQAKPHSHSIVPGGLLELR
jgi:hypothetical protein